MLSSLTQLHSIRHEPQASEAARANKFAQATAAPWNSKRNRKRGVLIRLCSELWEQKNIIQSATPLMLGATFWESLGTRRIDNPKKYMRGKYELWFFIVFIKKIPPLLNTARDKNEQQSVLRVALSPKTAMEILGPRLRIPSSLDIFLEQNLSTLSSA